MQKLLFHNSKGEEISFNNSPPYIFWIIEGLEIPDVEQTYIQGIYQHGHTLENVLLESRTITLTCHIHGKSGIKEMYARRKDLNRILNPLLGIGNLVYENDFGKWSIPAICKKNPYENKMREIQTLKLEFECPNPFFSTYEPTKVRLSYIEGGLLFPVKTPGFFGTMGYKVDIYNDGDEVVPLEFFIDGGALNPIIKNDCTGEFLQITKEVDNHDQIYINTDTENLEVSLIYTDPKTNKKMKRNAYGYLSLDSTLLTLKTGLNTLVFRSDDESRKVKIRIRYRKRFIGI